MTDQKRSIHGGLSWVDINKDIRPIVTSPPTERKHKIGAFARRTISKPVKQRQLVPPSSLRLRQQHDFCIVEVVQNT
jgi:hypothetical protein